MYEYNVQQTLPHKIWILIAFKAVGVLPVLRECVTIFSTFIFSWFEWFSDIFDHKVNKFWLRSVKMLCLVNKHFILQYFLTWCSPPPPLKWFLLMVPLKATRGKQNFLFGLGGVMRHCTPGRLSPWSDAYPGDFEIFGIIDSPVWCTSSTTRRSMI